MNKLEALKLEDDMIKEVIFAISKPRDNQINELLAEGHTPKTISEYCSISEKAIREHFGKGIGGGPRDINDPYIPGAKDKQWTTEMLNQRNNRNDKTHIERTTGRKVINDYPELLDAPS